MRVFAWGVFAAGALWACTSSEMPDHVEGAQVYAENCAVCHGAAARGDGELSGVLASKPSDLTLIARRNDGELPVSAVLSQIDGYGQNASARAAMPEFGAMFEGDLVPVETDDGVMTPTPRQLAALLVYLESIQR